ncbi:nucleotidyltransferase domain-containing protein [Bdellovibrio sp.]|jgi:predicted nucleotidyltransferase|uniref:type VII toxin-antitoxin system MntA family adenylyltransferase antitoxin n=1 Tax=Bdellovibrio TaxID=958 RepID=UPI003221FEE7
MPLQTGDLETALQTFLQKHPSVAVLGYFGSYAKGHPRSDSDVDICLAEDRPLSTEKKIQYINELTLLLRKEIDLLDLHTVNGVILKESLHTAKWVHKETAVYAQIMKRMLFDQADFQPYYQRMLKAKRERFLKS